MKKASLISLYIIIISISAQGQDLVEVFGYFETQVMGSQIKSDFYQLYNNKLRVDLQSMPSDQITFAANFDYITHHGKIEWNVLDFLSQDITAKIPDEMKALYIIRFNDEKFLDNAYLKLSFKYFDLFAGKQQISLGTGYVWNPIDVFNIRDPLDPTYEQPGHNGVRLDIPLGNLYSLSLLYSPQDSWRNSGKLIKFKGNIGHFDYSLVAIETRWLLHDYTLFDYDRMNFTEIAEKRQLLGTSIVGELLGLGVWTEFAYNIMEQSNKFYEIVVGGDYTFDFQTYVMFELYRNTLAKADYKSYNLNDWMRLFSAEQKSVTRDQLYCYIQHPITDFSDLSISAIYSISDASVALVPTLRHSFSNNVEIFAYINFNFGKEGTAYAESQGNGALVRARIYF
jgi:hypothetical protein